MCGKVIKRGDKKGLGTKARATEALLILTQSKTFILWLTTVNTRI
jgi:hypothetical protein